MPAPPSTPLPATTTTDPYSSVVSAMPYLTPPAHKLTASQDEAKILMTLRKNLILRRRAAPSRRTHEGSSKFPKIRRHRHSRRRPTLMHRATAPQPPPRAGVQPHRPARAV